MPCESPRKSSRKTHWALLAAAMILGAVCSINADAQEPMPMQISYIGQDGNVWLLEPDGGQQIRLTEEDGAEVVGYAWSPDGRYLAHVCLIVADAPTRVGGVEELHILDVHSGEDALVLADSRFNRYDGIGWSPAGSVLAMGTSDGLRILDIPTGELSQAIAPGNPGMGAGAPPHTQNLNWSADGQILAYEYLDGAQLIAISETPSVILDYRDANLPSRRFDRRSHPVFSPAENIVAWFVPGGRMEITDVFGNQIHNLSLDACSGGDKAWSIDGKSITLAGSSGLCTLNVQTGESRWLVAGASTWNPSWSPEGSRIAFSYVTGLGSEYFDIQTLGLANPENGTVTDLGIYGIMPQWRPAGGVTGVSQFLARKEGVISQLETAHFEILGAQLPVRAFNESAARVLIEGIGSNGNGAISQQHAEAFGRMTLQEETLSQLLPIYVATSQDQAEVFTHFLTLILEMRDKGDQALESCWTSGHRWTGSCIRLRRLIDVKLVELMGDVGRVQASYYLDPDVQEEFLRLWDMLIAAIRFKLDDGEPAVDILMDTGVKAAIVQGMVTFMYVNDVQPAIDQGVHSADPWYGGSEALWTPRGDYSRAELHMENLVYQSRSRAEFAYGLHNDLMQALDVTAALRDIADLASLTPARAYGKLVKYVTTVLDIGVAAWAGLENANSLGCTTNLSVEAGSLAFNPEQPVGACPTRPWLGPSWWPKYHGALPAAGDVYLLAALEPGGTYVSPAARLSVAARPGAATAEVVAYQAAVEYLLAAIEGDQEAEVEGALDQLEAADRALQQAGDMALVRLLCSTPPSQEGDAAIAKLSEHSMVALRLYLQTTGYLLSSAEERNLAAVQQAADDLLEGMADYDAALEVARQAGTPSRPLPIIDSIAFTEELRPGEQGQINVSIRNVGGTAARNLAVHLEIVESGLVAEGGVDGLEPEEYASVAFAPQFDEPGAVTAIAQLSMEGVLVDSQTAFVTVGVAEGTTTGEAEQGSEPWWMLFAGGGALVLGSAGVLIAVRRSKGKRRKLRENRSSSQVLAQARRGPQADRLPYCTHCGTKQVTAGGRFCHRCGRPIAPAGRN